MFSVFASLPLMQVPAPAAGGDSGSMWWTILSMVGLVVVFYFLMIRPQQKEKKRLEKMIESLKKGDKIVTIGGINGTVSSVRDKTVIVKVDDNAKIEFLKSAVATVVPKEDDKPAETTESASTETK